MTIRIGRMYYKGILQTRTQEAVREISSEITGSVRFGSGGVAAGANYFVLVKLDIHMFWGSN